MEEKTWQVGFDVRRVPLRLVDKTTGSGKAMAR